MVIFTGYRVFPFRLRKKSKLNFLLFGGVSIIARKGHGNAAIVLNLFLSFEQT